MINNKYYKRILDRTSDVVIITEASIIEGPDGPKILYVNDAFVQLTGYTKEEAIGKTPRILQGPETNKTTLRRIKDSLLHAKPVRVELYNYSKDGVGYWLDFSIVPLFDTAGEVEYFAAIERDITKQQVLKEEFKYLAAHDSLTGILNRREFMAQAKRLFTRFKRSKKMSLGLLMIDIDNFKQINDQRGHQEGDECLSLVANICLSLTREVDHVCRFGGDEFIILMRGVTKEILDLKANTICQRIHEVSNQQVSVSIGGGISDINDTGFEMLIDRADQALYKAKKIAKGTVYIENTPL